AITGDHTLDIWGDGEQTRSFMYIDDCVQGSQMILNGEPATDSLSKALIGILNPILDLDKDLGLQGAMDVTSICLKGNVMTAEGKARIPKLPEPAAQ
ncbi:NAD-dependent epimerase/dehydratase family protein, partial [bacterium]